MIDSYMALENPWKPLSKTNYIFNPNPKEQDICSNYTHCDSLLRPIKLLIASKSVHFSFFIWVECKLWNIFAFPPAWKKVLWSYWHLVVHPLRILTSHSYPNPLPCYVKTGDHLPNSYTHSRGPQYPWGWHSQHPRPSAWIFSPMIIFPALLSDTCTSHTWGQESHFQMSQAQAGWQAPPVWWVGALQVEQGPGEGTCALGEWPQARQPTAVHGQHDWSSDSQRKEEEKKIQTSIWNLLVIQLAQVKYKIKWKQ